MINNETTTMPGFYTAKLLALLDMSELKTLFYVLRHTVGKSKQSAWITLDRFMNGEPHKGQHGTGLTRASQIKACNQLVEFGLLTVVNQDNALGREWSAQLEEEGVDFDALEKRLAKRKAANRKRMQPLVEINSKKRAVQPKKTALPKPGFVYVMRGVYGYKIGRSADPEKRAKDLHNILVAYHAVDDMVFAERLLHRKFNGSRVYGEYFDLSEADLEYLFMMLDEEWVHYE